MWKNIVMFIVYVGVLLFGWIQPWTAQYPMVGHIFLAIVAFIVAFVYAAIVVRAKIKPGIPDIMLRIAIVYGYMHAPVGYALQITVGVIVAIILAIDFVDTYKARGNVRTSRVV